MNSMHVESVYIGKANNPQTAYMTDTDQGRVASERGL